MGPNELETQYAVAVELDELAQRSGDRELRSDAVWVRYIASMTRGDIWEARRQHALQLALAAELQQGSQLWYVGLLATVMALHDGRFADAEALIEETLAVGGRPRHGKPTSRACSPSSSCVANRVDSLELEQDVRTGSPTTWLPSLR